MPLEQVAQDRVEVSARRERIFYPLLKRVLDILASALLLVVLGPVMLLVALAIILDTGLPVIYRCQRVGRFGRPFTLLKFRTMRDGTHHHLEELLSVDEERRLEWYQNRKLRDDPRRTRVGLFLRRWSLDELPQLVNVLVGEMSLIGPRPVTAEEWDGRTEEADVLRMRPGLSGLWQVSGRSELDFETRMALEMAYVRQAGFKLDLQIALRTILAVLSGKGAY
jgi:lipopolysaccharide/colanic/teichoic acid biosynthesis glycosyltransferase